MREKLVLLLKDAVNEAHMVEQDALGVVFFGSRTRPKLHPYGPTATSDIDLAYVYRGTMTGPERSLTKALCKRLPWRLKRNWHTCTGLSADSLDEHFYDEGLRLTSVVRYFDEYSVVITVDPNVTQKINDLISHFGKKSTDGKV
jgi:predicted nucleotidyltransferase